MGKAKNVLKYGKECCKKLNNNAINITTICHQNMHKAKPKFPDILKNMSIGIMQYSDRNVCRNKC